MGHCTTIGTVVAGAAMARASGRMDGGGQMSIEARSSVGVRGLYPGTQIATQSFVGNDAFRRSVTSAQTSIVRVCPVLP